jgi:WD40 repeat protein
MCKVRENVSKMVSGSFNGEVIVWDLVKRTSIYKIDAFRNQTKEISCRNNLNFFLAAGDNNMVKLYNNH